MKRTALIFAGAAVFDLGVMTVSAQAQQTTQSPLIRPGTNAASQDQANSNRDHKHERTIFIKIDNLNTVRACTARRGEVVVHEGVQQCRLPTPDTPGDTPSTSWQLDVPFYLGAATDNGVRQSSPDHYIDKSNPVIFIKIDSVNTVQTCARRRGEVVAVEGVQQCRLPTPDAPAIGNPTPRPGGIPPRN